MYQKKITFEEQETNNDDQPTIGIEGLFQDFQRPPFDSAESQRIQPSSVKR